MLYLAGGELIDKAYGIEKSVFSIYYINANFIEVNLENISKLISQKWQLTRILMKTKFSFRMPSIADIDFTEK